MTLMKKYPAGKMADDPCLTCEPTEGKRLEMVLRFNVACPNYTYRFTARGDVMKWIYLNVRRGDTVMITGTVLTHENQRADGGRNFWSEIVVDNAENVTKGFKFIDE